MDTSDRRDPNLPARLPSAPPLTPASSIASYGDALGRDGGGGAASAVRISPQGILRGLARNWWKILSLWILLSAPLVYLVYSKVEPTYTAYSVLLAEPTQPDLYGGAQGGGSIQEISRYIATQIQSILSDRVLDAALADRAVAASSFVKNSESPRVDLKEALRVVNLTNTYNIQISLDSSNPREAAAIVNSVVAAYMEWLLNYNSGGNSRLKKRMEAWIDERELEKKAKEDELDRLVSAGVDPQSLIATSQKAAETSDDPNEAAKALTTKDVSLEQYRRYLDRLVQVNLELIPLESLLQQRMEAAQAQNDAFDWEADSQPSGLSEEELQARITAEFRQIPAVAQLLADIDSTNAELTHNVSIARKTGSEPSVAIARKRNAQLTARHDALWREHYEEIRNAVLAAAAAPTAPGAPAAPEALSLAELQAKVTMLGSQRNAIVDLLRSMEVETKESNNETFRAGRLSAEIQILRSRIEPVHKKLEDLKFQTDKETVRVESQGPAQIPKVPSSNKRNRYMAVALLGSLGLIMSLFALLEVKAERVDDPDALSSRIRSEVYSLPPLPSIRSQKRLGAPGDDDQIERFIQRLDHLRFAVCGDHPEVGLGRCVLITSAIGGEGKTTLAAQLAARCGHAGHSTLLIDADLRRGTLCPLLDIPEGLGLSDALKEEADVEDIAVPVQGGTFHLLRAGTPIHDTSRVFQGRGFGMLIARLRQLYDLIIIDSPPVLPVPDALIIGRWTDGAVLASRYDVSRAPQVERARHQLNNAGVPVLGTVINGMKSSDSYYGRYTYSRTRTAPAEVDDDAASPS